MVPSLLGLTVLLIGLVMIHYGTTGTLFPLTPIAAPATGEVGNVASSIARGNLGSVTSQGG